MKQSTSNTVLFLLSVVIVIAAFMGISQAASIVEAGVEIDSILKSSLTVVVVAACTMIVVLSGKKLS